MLIKQHVIRIFQLDNIPILESQPIVTALGQLSPRLGRCQANPSSGINIGQAVQNGQILKSFLQQGSAIKGLFADFSRPASPLWHRSKQVIHVSCKAEEIFLAISSCSPLAVIILKKWSGPYSPGRYYIFFLTERTLFSVSGYSLPTNTKC